MVCIANVYTFDISIQTKNSVMKLYNIKYKNGSNEIQLFASIKDFGTWWCVSVKLGNRRAGSVKSITTIS